MWRWDFIYSSVIQLSLIYYLPAVLFFNWQKRNEAIQFWISKREDSTQQSSRVNVIKRLKRENDCYNETSLEKTGSRQEVGSNIKEYTEGQLLVRNESLFWAFVLLNSYLFPLNDFSNICFFVLQDIRLIYFYFCWLSSW